MKAITSQLFTSKNENGQRLLGHPAMLCMLAVELVENHAEEQQEYQTGFADLEQPVVRVRYPAGNADTEEC